MGFLFVLSYVNLKMYRLIQLFIFSTSLLIAKPKSIAVLDFEGKDISDSEASILTDRLRSELFNLGNYKVLERALMEDILREQGLQQAGICNSSECAVEIGNLLGVQQLVGGSVGKIGNMYTASIFMSLISSLVEASSNDNEFANKKIGFISYGSGSKAKIFEGTVQTNWKDKIERVKLFQNLDSRKKISIEIYEQLHKRKVSSNINNNQGIIKLKNIDKGEFTEGLRNYFKY